MENMLLYWNLTPISMENDGLPSKPNWVGHLLMRGTTMISIELSVIPAHPPSDETNVSRRECASGTQQRKKFSL